MTSADKDPRGESQAEAKEDFDLVWEGTAEGSLGGQDQEERKKEEQDITFIQQGPTTAEPRRRFVFDNSQAHNWPPLYMTEGKS